MKFDCQSMMVTAISGEFPVPVKYGLFPAALPRSAQALEPPGICGSNQFGSHCCDALCACSYPVSLSLFISLYSVTSIVSTCFCLAFGMSAINTCVRRCASSCTSSCAYFLQTFSLQLCEDLNANDKSFGWAKYYHQAG